jgi:hypothetical protein
MYEEEHPGKTRTHKRTPNQHDSQVGEVHRYSTESTHVNAGVS